MKKYRNAIEIIFICMMSLIFNISLNWLDMNFKYIWLVSALFIVAFIGHYWWARKNILKTKNFLDKPVEFKFSDVLKHIAIKKTTDDFERKMQEKLMPMAVVAGSLIIGLILDLHYLLTYSLIGSIFFLMYANIFCNEFKHVAKALSNIDGCSVKATLNGEPIDLDSKEAKEAFKEIFGDIAKYQKEDSDEIDDE